MFITKDDPEQIRKLATAASIPNEKLAITAASRAEVPNLLEASDIGFFFIKPSFSKKSSSPTKLAEILGMGNRSSVTQVSEISNPFLPMEISDWLSMLNLNKAGTTPSINWITFAS